MIVVAVIGAYQLAGVIGIAFAATAMLALAGMVVALDAYGPVTDNAGGIAEMAGLEHDVRLRSTDALDAVGNTTKAVTKGYAIGSAALAALVLFGAYTADLKEFFPALNVDFSLSNPYVIVGLLLGALLPFTFGAFGMTAVGRAAGAVVVDVRDQFRSKSRHHGGGPAGPITRAPSISSPSAAIREMIMPSPAARARAGRGLFRHRGCGGAGERLRLTRRAAAGRDRLGAVRRHLDDKRVAAHGTMPKNISRTAIMAARDRDAHKAAVTGDTVGDPYKDTAGPAVNPMIKITNIVALLLLAALAAHAG